MGMSRRICTAHQQQQQQQQLRLETVCKQCFNRIVGLCMKAHNHVLNVAASKATKVITVLPGNLFLAALCLPSSLLPSLLLLPQQIALGLKCGQQWRRQVSRDGNPTCFVMQHAFSRPPANAALLQHPTYAFNLAG